MRLATRTRTVCAAALAEVQETYEELGGDIVESVLYEEGKTDYRSELQRLSAADPEIYVYTAYGQDAATLNQQAYELGLNDKPWYGIYLSMNTSDSPPEAVEGQVGMEVNYVGPDGDFYREAYQEAYGEEMQSSFSAYPYDAAKLVAAAVEEAGCAEPASIRDALTEVDDAYQAATGPIVFDEDGQRTEQPYIRLPDLDHRSQHFRPHGRVREPALQRIPRLLGGGHVSVRGRLFDGVVQRWLEDAVERPLLLRVTQYVRLSDGPATLDDGPGHRRGDPREDRVHQRGASTVVADQHNMLRILAALASDNLYV
jgi:hypothetical protein